MLTKRGEDTSARRGVEPPLPAGRSGLRRSGCGRGCGIEAFDRAPSRTLSYQNKINVSAE
eukprot:8133432-Alexandrium_andersonii.AAC.1